MVYQSNDAWVLRLTAQGHWQFASRFLSRTIRFRKFGVWNIDDLADLERNGLLDTLCAQWHPSEDALVFVVDKEKERRIGHVASLWLPADC